MCFNYCSKYYPTHTHTNIHSLCAHIPACIGTYAHPRTNIHTYIHAYMHAGTGAYLANHDFKWKACSRFFWGRGCRRI